MNNENTRHVEPMKDQTVVIIPEVMRHLRRFWDGDPLENLAAGLKLIQEMAAKGA